MPEISRLLSTKIRRYQYVEKKIPRSKLDKSAILPSDIEGIPVDVVEIGKVEAL